MTEEKNLEREFSELLQQGEKEKAIELIVNAKAEERANMGRVPQCRALVMLIGEAEDIIDEAMKPQWLKLSADKLLATVEEKVAEYKASGKATMKRPKRGGTAKGKKKKTRGLKPGAPPPDEEDEKDKEESKGEPSKDDPPEEDTPKEDEKSSQDDEKASQSPEKAEEAPGMPPGAGMSPEAVLELLRTVESKLDSQIAEVDGKIGEVLINTSALIKASSAKGGQEKRHSEGIERLEEKIDKYHVL